jgi:hypothetical protein
MLRAEIHMFPSGPTLKLEGRLVGEWAEQARSLVTKASVPAGLVVDLTDVSYVDEAGEKVLTWFQSIGAVFIARGVYVAGVCERLKLPLKKEPGSSRSERHHGTARGASPDRTRAK